MDRVYRERLRAVGLDTVGRVLERVEGRVAAWSRTTDTLHVPGPDGAPGFYVKRYSFPRWSNRIRGTFRGTFFGLHRGQAEYQALAQMRNAGVPAVRPVACGGRRVAHFLAACFLITEEVPQAVNLTTFAQQVQDGRRTLSRGQRHELIMTLARAVARMHAGGISHGNLFWRNILLRDGIDGSPEFYFLDARPLHAWERFGSRGNWWLTELAQVTVSALPFTAPADRLRFILAYANTRQLNDEGKAQVRQIMAMTQAWMRHERRRIHMNRLFEKWNAALDDEIARGTALLEAEPAT